MEVVAYVIVAIITTLGSAGAWKFYTEWRRDKREDTNFYNRTIKENYIERITLLESSLLQSRQEKKQLWEEILTLTSKVAELSVKVNYLEEENEKLKRELRIERTVK